MTRESNPDESYEYRGGYQYGKEAARGATEAQIRTNLENIKPISDESPEFYRGWRKAAQEELDIRRPWWKFW